MVEVDNCIVEAIGVLREQLNILKVLIEQLRSDVNEEIGILRADMDTLRESYIQLQERVDIIE